MFGNAKLIFVYVVGKRGRTFYECVALSKITSYDRHILEYMTVVIRRHMFWHGGGKGSICYTDTFRVYSSAF